eukprot:4572356-Lingulodinium_polyedra.AAC.1
MRWGACLRKSNINVQCQDVQDQLAGWADTECWDARARNSYTSGYQTKKPAESKEARGPGRLPFRWHATCGGAFSHSLLRKRKTQKHCPAAS